MTRKPEPDVAFSGQKSRERGGRWNSCGIPVIYTGGAISLAVLEILVHLQGGQPLPVYWLFPVDLEDSLVSAVEIKRLPRDWRASPAPREVQAVGDEWARSQVSLALKVPSAVIPQIAGLTGLEEANYLLNPLHPDFSQLQIGHPERFSLDLRFSRDRQE